MKSSVADPYPNPDPPDPNPDPPDPNPDPPDKYVLGLLDADPNPLVRGLDPDPAPDPSIIKQN